MEEIAIIGVSCLFPGAETPDQFWRNLLEGRDATSPATTEQIGVDPEIFYDPRKGQVDKSYCMRGGFVRDFQFDASGYGIRARHLDGLDDLFKWALYVSREALKDGGYEQADLGRCGLVLGNLSLPTRSTRRYFGALYNRALTPLVRQSLDNERFALETLPGEAGAPENALLSGYPAAVVARGLGLDGPAFAIDAACASSLYAIDLACRCLRSGRADLMLAGAVSCADPLFVHQGFSIFQAYPENGRSRPLDRCSQGLVAAEGAGAFALKRCADAVHAGDRIYALIRGVGLSNDGSGKSVLNPDMQGQILSFERAYASAGLDPGAVDYIECHATGTPVGDRCEMDAMAAFWRGRPLPKIGSVKSNLGHMLTAAGMASVLKVVLAMGRGQIPPTIHIEDPQRSSDGALGPDQIATEPTPWPERGPIRRAGVSAFGFGGTNAHMVLEGPQEPRASVKKTQAAPVQSPPIAIVGMDASFGGCADLSAFTRAIYQGQSQIGPLPAARWKGFERCKDLLADYGLDAAPEGAYIEGLDIDFLNIKTPPNAADQLIPQQLLMLQVADRALRDAGLARGSRTGVVVAMGVELANHAYLGRCDLSWQIRAALAHAGIALRREQIAELEAIGKDSLHPRAQANQYTSFIGNIMAGRIAALWDFSGPAFTLSAEESGVVNALDVAQMLLGNGEVEAMLVGAVDLAGSPEHVLVRHHLSPCAHNRDADGWTVGEGAGAVVLKRCRDAESKRIYATIEAVGRVRGASDDSDALPAAPSEAIVSQACKRAFAQANVDPSAIGYLELAGSGIAAEDAAEIAGTVRAYSATGQDLSCAVGSVKANIGHAFNASGMAALIKTALCLHHRFLPVTPNWKAPHQAWENNPFYVPGESAPWFTSPAAPTLMAAVNILGCDSGCAHLVLSGAQQTRPVSPRALWPPHRLLPIAGESADELLSELDRLERGLRDRSVSSLADECFQRLQERPAAPYTLSLLAAGQEDLSGEIAAARQAVPRSFATGAAWSSAAGSYFTAEPLGPQAKTAFVYPGSANAYIGLGRELWQLFPDALAHMVQFSTQVGERLAAHLLYPRSRRPLSARAMKRLEAGLSEEAVAMFQIGVGFAVLHTHIIRDEFKVQPQMAFGYSLGESSMLFSLGVWRDADLVSQRMAGSAVFREQLFGAKTLLRQAWGLADTADDGSFWSTYVLRATAADVEACLTDEARV